MQYDFGIIGLGTMGRNLLLQIADRGFTAAGLDTNVEQVAAMEAEIRHRKIYATDDVSDFLAALNRPRRILLLIPAGAPVDAVIETLMPELANGDILVDGGNSHYKDTERRMEYLGHRGFHFMGLGISGGEEGARKGACLMPGGDLQVWLQVAPILTVLAAKIDREPCVAYIGRGASGHLVKTVHNGIEYGLMQLIAEAYDMLRQVGGLDNAQLHNVFLDWHKGMLQSFLMEITAHIFAAQNDQGEGQLVDYLLDKAQQKGTGRWTSQIAMEMGVPTPTIDAAVSMRGLSNLWDLRQRIAQKYGDDEVTKTSNTDAFVLQVEHTLLFGFILTYAQGFHLLAEANRQQDLQLNLAEVARIWRGGCIISAELLEDIHQAYAAKAGLENILDSSVFRGRLKTLLPSVRAVLGTALQSGIPLLGTASALHYFEAFRTARLPLNLTQAQRDYFGAHTYERTDQEGTFRGGWK